MTPFTPVPGVAYDSCTFPDPDGHVAVVCLWEPVERVATRHQEAYMVGPCVSPVGVDFVIRTLLANPQITVLRVEGPDLSGTKALLDEALAKHQHGQPPRRVPGGMDWNSLSVQYILRSARRAVIVPVPPPDPGESPTGWGWPGVVTAYFDAIHEEIR